MIAVALWLLLGGRDTCDISVLDRLPDHDYLAEINDLMKQHRWGEAKTLCEDVIALDLPCAKDAKALKEKSESESKKIFNRLYKVGKGFITGEPDKSLEELGGSVASDLFMYGDIRDLAKQGWYKVTGRETDPVIIGLAAVGLLTEFVDVADWAPAALKAFRKVGAMTDAMGKYIINLASNIVKTKKINSAGKTFFKNLNTLLDQAGFIRSASIVKHAQNADNIALLAKNVRQSPHATHLVARAADKQTCEVIEAVNKHKDSPALMKKIAQKGAGSVKFITRGGKIMYKGHLAQFLRQLLGGYFYLLCLILFGGGGFLIYRSIKNIKNIFPFKNKKAQA
ncbi:MAG: hypothetical protein E7052_09965 [Lentisphaerae bacterium]|nr:hypothetical protein [Lentisphaerota bacterium]